MFDVVECLVSWFPAKAGAPAFAAVPAPRPFAFITVERTGGAAALGRDEPTVAVDCYADSPAAARRMALTVSRSAVALLWQDVREVCACSVNSMYDNPDPDSRQSRWTVLLDLVTRP